MDLADLQTSQPITTQQMRGLEHQEPSKTKPETENSAREHAQVTADAPRVISVQASHYQGDNRYDPFSRNHQCTCNALAFLAYHSEGTHFRKSDLDSVLQVGDALYTRTKRQLIAEGKFQSEHLTMEEVPVSVTTNRHTYIVHKSDVLMGSLRVTGRGDYAGWWLSLSERLQCLSADVTHALLTISPLCIAVFRDRSGRYGFFDPHARTAEGLPDRTGNGTAVMLTFTHLNDMIERLHMLYRRWEDNEQYDFMPVNFEMVSNCLLSPSVTAWISHTRTSSIQLSLSMYEDALQGTTAEETEDGQGEQRRLY
ncbi:uncharacterized protein LOC115375642 [Myripristis murdjan]|uniref:uncharacterized protein LOC115375642 n=1 Tax=Myripristis murdjan TaxID=586833 RepID=UPI00117622CD|nr:uncharacterized protein LOC115375642 [Myripristis murdjan]